MNLAKSLIGPKKTIVIIAHLCSEMAVLGRYSTQCFEWSIRYLSSKHAVHSYLRNRTTAQTEYLMGCTVNNLLKLWECKLFCPKRHPSVQKAKNMKYRALLQWKEEKLLPLSAPRLIDQSDTRRRMIQIPDSVGSQTADLNWDRLSLSCWKSGRILSM
jgi:hypothetical protein